MGGWENVEVEEEDGGGGWGNEDAKADMSGVLNDGADGEKDIGGSTRGLEVSTSETEEGKRER